MVIHSHERRLYEPRELALGKLGRKDRGDGSGILHQRSRSLKAVQPGSFPAMDRCESLARTKGHRSGARVAGTSACRAADHDGHVVGGACGMSQFDASIGSLADREGESFAD